MTVKQLREALESLPGHWPVVVGYVGVDDVHYMPAREVELINFPTQGNMASIVIDDPTR